MRLPPPSLDETHILLKIGRFVEAWCHLCSKTSYFTMGARTFAICVQKPRILQWVRPFRRGVVPFVFKNLVFYNGCAHFCHLCSKTSYFTVGALTAESKKHSPASTKRTFCHVFKKLVFYNGCAHCYHNLP